MQIKTLVWKGHSWIMYDSQTLTPVLAYKKDHKKAKVYAVRHHDRSLCTQKQPRTAALKAAFRKSDPMGGQPGHTLYACSLSSIDPRRSQAFPQEALCLMHLRHRSCTLSSNTHMARHVNRSAAHSSGTHIACQVKPHWSDHKVQKQVESV